MNVTFYNSRGKGKLEKHLALIDGVQAELKSVASAAADRAKIGLSRHRRSGDSFIYLEHGKVDWHVGINDERGDKAAQAIEMGTHVLARAFALAGSEGRR